MELSADRGPLGDNMLMDINRFTEKLQEALRSAQTKAIRNGNQQVDVEHLLAALLEQSGGLAPAILTIALDMIADDCPLSRVADELNLRGYRTRQANPWTPPALFNLLPRMIQVSPQLLKSERWTSRRKKLTKLT